MQKLLIKPIMSSNLVKYYKNLPLLILTELICLESGETRGGYRKMTAMRNFYKL